MFFVTWFNQSNTSKNYKIELFGISRLLWHIRENIRLKQNISANFNPRHIYIRDVIVMTQHFNSLAQQISRAKTIVCWSFLHEEGVE